MQFEVEAALRPKLARQTRRYGFKLYHYRGGQSMDYIISGVTALFLLIYLLYALLRPERF